MRLPVPKSTKVWGKPGQVGRCVWKWPLHRSFQSIILIQHHFMNCMFTIQAFNCITASPECNLIEDRDCTLVTHDSHARHLVGYQNRWVSSQKKERNKGKNEGRIAKRKKKWRDIYACLSVSSSAQLMRTYIHSYQRENPRTLRLFSRLWTMSDSLKPRALTCKSFL